MHFLQSRNSPESQTHDKLVSRAITILHEVSKCSRLASWILGEHVKLLGQRKGNKHQDCRGRFVPIPACASCILDVVQTETKKTFVMDNLLKGVYIANSFGRYKATLRDRRNIFELTIMKLVSSLRTMLDSLAHSSFERLVLGWQDVSVGKGTYLQA